MPSPYIAGGTVSAAVRRRRHVSRRRTKAAIEEIEEVLGNNKIRHH